MIVVEMFKKPDPNIVNFNIIVSLESRKKLFNESFADDLLYCAGEYLSLDKMQLYIQTSKELATYIKIRYDQT